MSHRAKLKEEGRRVGEKRLLLRCGRGFATCKAPKTLEIQKGMQRKRAGGKKGGQSHLWIRYFVESLKNFDTRLLKEGD